MRFHFKRLPLPLKKKLNLAFQTTVTAGKYLGTITHKETLKRYFPRH